MGCSSSTKVKRGRPSSADNRRASARPASGSGGARPCAHCGGGAVAARARTARAARMWRALRAVRAYAWCARGRRAWAPPALSLVRHVVASPGLSEGPSARSFGVARVGSAGVGRGPPGQAVSPPVRSLCVGGARARRGRRARGAHRGRAARMRRASRAVCAHMWRPGFARGRRARAPTSFSLVRHVVVDSPGLSEGSLGAPCSVGVHRVRRAISRRRPSHRIQSSSSVVAGAP